MVKVRNLLGAGSAMFVLAACYGMPPDKYGETGWTDDTGPVLEDLDGDGFDSLVDCDDTNPEIHPDADEVCDDEIDNDCDALIDAADEECAD